MKFGFYDRDGKEITQDAWSILHRQSKYKFIKQTRATDGKFISTVWLGTDHNYLDDGNPIIFETMVFEAGGGVDLACQRYETEEEALLGHDNLVSLIENNQPFGYEAGAE